MIGLRDVREKVRQNPRAQAVVGLIPLTFVVLVVLPLTLSNSSGPHHGVIIPTLELLAVISLALFWFGVLKLPTTNARD
jgi:hypothetical protein